MPYRSRQPSLPLNGPSGPMAEPIGTWLMFCTPPATTRSAVPLSTAWAAKCTACWDEPHCRSTVTPGTASGRPAASHAVRAMSPAWGRPSSTQPNITSSTAFGSTWVRVSSSLMTCAPRSAGCARGQAAAAAGDGSAHGVDNEGLGHGVLSLVGC